MVRQASWVGIFSGSIIWLQLARLVNIFVVLVLAAGFVAIESLLRLRERSRWQIPDVGDENEAE